MRTTFKHALKLVAGVAALTAASLAGAATASVGLSQFLASSPPAAIDVNVNVFDVSAGAAVGAYDITIHYDASVWAATSVTFGSFLSGPNPLGSFVSYSINDPGVVQLSEVSLITPLDPQPLPTLQPDAFTFATIRFASVGQGVGAFSIGDAALFDALGDVMTVSVVPEPASIAMAMLGLAVVGMRVARSRATASMPLGAT